MPNIDWIEPAGSGVALSVSALTAQQTSGVWGFQTGAQNGALVNVSGMVGIDAANLTDGLALARLLNGVLHINA